MPGSGWHFSPDLLWQKRAECKDVTEWLGHDPFFPVECVHRPSGAHKCGECVKADRAYSIEAKKICASCSVRSECLEWALSHGEKWGVWGGLTVEERRREFAERQHRKHARGPARGEFCRRGIHKMDGQNVLRTPEGSRRCRACKKENDRVNQWRPRLRERLFATGLA